MSKSCHKIYTFIINSLMKYLIWYTRPTQRVYFAECRGRHSIVSVKLTFFRFWQASSRNHSYIIVYNSQLNNSIHRFFAWKRFSFPRIAFNGIRHSQNLLHIFTAMIRYRQTVWNGLGKKQVRKAQINWKWGGWMLAYEWMLWNSKDRFKYVI